MGPGGKRFLLLLAAAISAGDEEAAAEPRCTAAARVSGAPALVGPVVHLLRERGVPVGGTSQCGAISAVLASEEERVRITIIDSDGRTIERVVDDVEGAATAVESWARGDLLDPLLAARSAPLEARQAPDREPPPVIEVRSGPEPRSRDIELGALADFTYSGDGA